MDPQPAAAEKPSLQYVSVYYVRGGTGPKHWRRYALSDPPTAGNSRAIVIPGEKRSTIFCPFTLQAYQVPNGCGELATAKELPFLGNHLAEIIQRKWADFDRMGAQKDYDVAALVLTRLGAEVPKIIRPVVERVDGEGRSQGKGYDEERLRPIRRTSKRGEVASFFLSDEPQSIREAMAKLELTRSGVLSHLFCIHRDHGIGYHLANDCAILLAPEGYDIFAVPEPSADGSIQPGGGRRGPQGRPLDTEKLRPIKRASRRGDVTAYFLSPEFRSIDGAEKELELTRSGVLSHLFCVNTEHGLGYEVSGDGASARLVVPEDYDPFAEVEGGPKASRGPSGKPMDGTRFKPIDPKSKRGEVAAAFLAQLRAVDSVAVEMELTRSGVLSHLHSLWKFHGVGYSVGEGELVTMLWPAGQELFKAKEPVAAEDDWG
jgi:hypothetical protein